MKAAGNVWLLFFLEGADSGRASAHSPPGLQGFFRRGGAFRPPRNTERQDKIKDPSEDGSFILYSTGLLSFGLRGFFSAGFRSLLHHRATAIADLRRIEFGTGGFRDGRGSGRSAFSNRSCGSGERSARSERTATVFGSRVVESTARETVTTVAAAVAATVTAGATGLAHAITAILMITAEAVVLTAVVAAVVVIAISAGSHFLGADGVTERRLHIRRDFLDDRSTQHGDERIHFRENKNAENRHNEGDDERYDFYYH